MSRPIHVIRYDPQRLGLSGRGLEYPFGRLDHLSYDPATAQMFLSCLGDDSVLVIDAFAGCVTQRLAGLCRPQVHWQRGVREAGEQANSVSTYTAPQEPQRWRRPPTAPS